MQLHRPEPSFMNAARTRQNFALAARIAITVTAVIWFAWLSDAWLGLDLARYGLHPRSADGLVGIVTAPLLHGSLEHLFSNTLPLLVALTAILYLYPNSAMRVLPMVWLGTGLLAWLIGRPSIHIGASGFVYGILAYVFVSGMFRQDLRSVAVSLMVWFLYGSMIWGVLPIRSDMSWEMHLSGAVLGTVMAVLYRRWDRVPIKRYEWEDDDTVPDWYPEDGQDGNGDENDRGNR